jgi:hypothetical protein
VNVQSATILDRDRGGEISGHWFISVRRQKASLREAAALAGPAGSAFLTVELT